MLKEIPFAKALALVSGAGWVVCFLFVALFPGFSLTLSRNLMHGLDISVLGNWQLTVNNFISGLVVMIISGWLFGWVLAWVYNKLAKMN